MKLKCPSCGNAENRVLESRNNKTNTTIRRRRECLHCFVRFTTHEVVKSSPLMVIKKADGREFFSKEKLQKGILVALKGRPTSRSTLDHILNSIEEKAEQEGKVTNEIRSDKLGEMVLKELYHIDKVAYIRFASVYRQFETLEEFVKEIEELSL